MNLKKTLIQFDYFIVLAGFCGLAYCFYLYFEILNPVNVAWLLQGGDPVQHYIGWCFFRNDQWSFPLGFFDNISYYAGNSIIYTDSIPLLALFFKLFHPLLPAQFQYFGLYLLINFILQAVFGYRLLRCWIKNRWICLAGSLIFLMSPVLLMKTYKHIALSSHWLILLGLYLLFKKHDSYQWGKWLTALLLSLAIHPYLMLMVFALTLIDLLDLTFVRKLMALKALAGHFFALSLVIFIAAYGLGLFVVQTDATVTGFGKYSLNLSGLIDPMGFSRLLKDRAHAEGQYEGFSYLGAGVLLLFCFSLFELLKKDQKTWLRLLKKYAVHLLILLGLTLFALSNIIRLGNQVILQYPIPFQFLTRLFNTFRSSGRFFWPVYYVILLFSFYIFKQISWKRGIGLLLMLLLLQFYDLSVIIKNTSRYEHKKHEYQLRAVLKADLWQKIPEHYSRFCFIDSFFSVPHAMDIAYFSALNQLSINSFYVARGYPKKHEILFAREKKDFFMGNFNEKTVYLINRQTTYESIKKVLGDQDLLIERDQVILLLPGGQKLIRE